MKTICIICIICILAGAWLITLVGTNQKNPAKTV